MRLVVDTGVFSAALSRRRRQAFEPHIEALRNNQLFLSVVTVAELRYGAIVAEWGDPRRRAEQILAEGDGRGMTNVDESPLSPSSSISDAAVSSV